MLVSSTSLTINLNTNILRLDMDVIVLPIVVAVLGLLVILFLCRRKWRRTKKDDAALAAITDPNLRRFSRPLSSSQRGEGDWWQPTPDGDDFRPPNTLKKADRHSYHSANRMSHISQHSAGSRHSAIAAQRPYSQGGQGYTYGQTLENSTSALSPGSRLSANVNSRPQSLLSASDRQSAVFSGSSAAGSSISGRQSQYLTPTNSPPPTRTNTTSNTPSNLSKPFQIPDVGGSSVGHDSNSGHSHTAHAAIGYRFGAAMGTIPEDPSTSSHHHGSSSHNMAPPTYNIPPSAYNQLNQPANLQYLQPQMTGASVYSTTDPYETSAMTKSSSGHPGT
jgi:hypothetical protein